MNAWCKHGALRRGTRASTQSFASNFAPKAMGRERYLTIRDFRKGKRNIWIVAGTRIIGILSESIYRKILLSAVLLTDVGSWHGAAVAGGQVRRRVLRVKRTSYALAETYRP